MTQGEARFVPDRRVLNSSEFAVRARICFPRFDPVGQSLPVKNRIPV